MFGWVIFRCDTLRDALSFFKSMFGFNGLFGNDTVPAPILLQRAGVNTVFLVTLVFAIVFSAPVIPWLKNKIKNMSEMKAKYILCASDCILVVLLVASSIQLALGSYNPFIYFEF